MSNLVYGREWSHSFPQLCWVLSLPVQTFLFSSFSNLTGAFGIAVVSVLFNAPDVREATAKLRDLLQPVFEHTT